MARATLACHKKEAREEGYVVAYTDEAAFSYRPFVGRTWAPKGQPAVLSHGPIRGGVQAVSLLTDTGKVFFEVKPGTFKAPDMAHFFESVIKRYRRYGLIIILDRAQTHCSKEIKALKAKYGERLIFE